MAGLVYTSDRRIAKAGDQLLKTLLALKGQDHPGCRVAASS